MRLLWASGLLLGALASAEATDDKPEVKNVAIIGEFLSFLERDHGRIKVA
jgi:hypothetical protein